MEETLKTIRFSHRLLIIACSTILSFIVLHEQNENYYQSALIELQHIKSTLRDIVDVNNSSETNFQAKNKFLSNFRFQFKDYLDSAFTVSFSPSEFAVINKNGTIIVEEKVPENEIKYDITKQKLKHIHKELISFLSDYKYVKENQFFIEISPPERLSELQNLLKIDSKIKSLKTRLLRDSSKNVVDTSAVVVVTVQQSNTKILNYQFLLKAVLHNKNVNVDTIMMSNGLINIEGKNFEVLPALTKLKNELWDMEIDEALVALNVKSSEWRRNNSDQAIFLGIHIKERALIYLSPIFLFSLMFYMLSLLLHLVNILDHSEKIENFPWMGVIQNIPGKILTWITILILPPLTCILMIVYLGELSYFEILTIIIATISIIWVGLKILANIKYFKKFQT